MRERELVGVNASIIGEDPTGLGLYSTKVTRELDRIRDDLLVYTSRPEALGSVRARITRVPAATRPEYSMKGHFIRLGWLQSALRLRVGARVDRLKLLFNTVPEGVLWFHLPQITVVHDLLPLRFPLEYPRQQYYFRFLVSKILKESRIVVADSESTRRDIIQNYGLPAEKVRVIYPGYDSRVYFPNGCVTSAELFQEPYCLYVGNVLPHKNLLRLLDATAILRRRTRCRLVIRGQGRGDYEDALRRRVETLGLNDAVVFLRYMTESELRELYTCAACLVLPSLGEGFGLPALEAMACGTPVLVAGTSALPEVVGNAAFTVHPYDTIGLAEAMYQVLSSGDVRQELRQRGLERVRSFGWRRTAEQVSSLLDEVQSTPRAVTHS